MVRLRPAHVRLPARPPERTLHEAVILFLAQSARVPPAPPLIQHIVAQIVLLGLPEQNLRLLRQARHVREARTSSARADPALEALSSAPLNTLCADVASLALRVVCAHLDRDRDGLLFFFVGVVLLGAASFLNLLAELVMASRFPVLSLAVRPAVGRFAAAALLGHWWQSDSAGGASRENSFLDHRVESWSRWFKKRWIEAKIPVRETRQQGPAH